jgi:ATP-dependent Clp protease ATP-binding subunit ClpA
LSFFEESFSPSENKPKQEQNEDEFGIDLVQRAKLGKIDPVIGREEEITRVIRTLSRKTKNSPLLIGEAGVGKSAIVEGLALAVASGKVPETLRGKKIISIDLAR